MREEGLPPPPSSLWYGTVFVILLTDLYGVISKKKLSSLKIRLEDRLDEYAGNLSGGQRQALSLIIATFSDYEVLLPDEITSSLTSK